MKTCANCKRELSYVWNGCRKCHKPFCSVALRDCILVHGCEEQTHIEVHVERPEGNWSKLGMK